MNAFKEQFRDFYFIRHGQTNWNVERRLQGHMDVPLNAVGEGQAFAAGERLRHVPIDVCVSSDLGRAFTTAQSALRYHDAVPLHKHQGLREWCFGDWEGRLLKDVKEELGIDPATRAKDCPAPTNGESWAEFEARALGTIAECLATHEGNVLITAHGFVYVALMLNLMGKDEMCDNAVPYHFTCTNGVWRAEEV